MPTIEQVFRPRPPAAPAENPFCARPTGVLALPAADGPRPVLRAYPGIPPGQAEVGVPAMAETDARRPRRRWAHSPNVGALRTFRDVKTSRIVARHHALELEAGHDRSLADSVGAIASAIALPYRGKRHTMASFEATRRAVCAMHAPRDGDIVNLVAGGTGKGRSDPLHAGTSIRVDPAHLVDDGLGLAGHVQLRCTTSAMRRDRVGVAWYPLNVSWRQHAAERALERSHRPAPANIQIDMGRWLTRLSPLIAVLCETMSRASEDVTVPVPYGDGVLLGSMGVVQPGIAIAKGIYCVGVDRMVGRIDRYDAQSIWAELLSLGRMRTWTAMTFLGPDELSREQSACLGLLRERWSSRVETEVARLANDVVRYAADHMASHFKLRRVVACGDDARNPYSAIEYRNEARMMPRVPTTGWSTDMGCGEAASIFAATGLARPVAVDRVVAPNVPLRCRDHDDDPVRKAIRSNERRNGAGRTADTT